MFSFDAYEEPIVIISMSMTEISSPLTELDSIVPDSEYYVVRQVVLLSPYLSWWCGVAEKETASFIALSGLDVKHNLHFFAEKEWRVLMSRVAVDTTSNADIISVIQYMHNRFHTTRLVDGRSFKEWLLCK